MEKITLRQFKETFGRKAFGELAVMAGSSVKYFDSYASEPPRRRPSKKTCDTLSKLRPELFSFQSLRPDLFS